MYFTWSYNPAKKIRGGLEGVVEVVRGRRVKWAILDEGRFSHS
jgi:hypothetical protein